MKILLSLEVITLTFLNLSCGLSSEQRKEAKEAVEALQKLQAGVDSGQVSRMSISPLIVEAKAQVNQADGVLLDGDLKKALDTAMSAYIDGTELWGKGVLDPYKYDCDADDVADYRHKYPDNPDLKDDARCLTDQSVTYLYSLASENVTKAAGMIK